MRKEIPESVYKNREKINPRIRDNLFFLIIVTKKKF